MKSNAMPIVVAIVFLATAAATHAQEQDAAATEAKTMMATKLFDAESARFLDVVRVVSPETGKTRIICGWVNAKNTFGGYVGFRPFFVAGDMVQVRDPDPDSADSYSNSLFSIMWDTCIPPTAERFGDDLVKLPKMNIDKYCASLRKYVKDPANCERDENESRDWLMSHPTASWIATRCNQKARESRSYGSTKGCVTNMEADIVFQRGPKAR
jgi:hypothetical protein